MTDTTPTLLAEGISRTYGSGDAAVRACRDVAVQVFPGQLVVVRGPSGSGKTTLLNCLGGLDRPDSGQVWLDGRELTALREDDRIQLRQTEIGFIFQSFGLIPVLSAAENVEVPLRLVKTAGSERAERVAELLGTVGLERHHHQRPAELSGGQQQRVGVARALANRPKLLIADEPTGQLDSGTAASVMDLISGLVRQSNVAAVVSTHDPLLVARADVVLELHDGAVVERLTGQQSLAEHGDAGSVIGAADVPPAR
ncbi:ABC transporter ATP-binding protein [Arthrobacter castelli]|uniref:ABC transporter ATP-binding protein n=1 Tax=Arthrobacter castelli TaxID=271431 RepID=UPI0003F5FE78|nr:ABC transporter ATP-binding protein [Arthrobacter castelli]